MRAQTEKDARTDSSCVQGPAALMSVARQPTVRMRASICQRLFYAVVWARVPTQLCAGGAAKEANNVEVSRHTENQILEVLKTRDGATTELAQAGIRTVRKVWEELIELGFTQEDTADAIRSAPTVSLADCLDWLCIKLEEHRLPRRFRSSYRPSDITQAQLTVVAPTRRADTSEPAPPEPRSILEEPAKIDKLIDRVAQLGETLQTLTQQQKEVIDGVGLPPLKKPEITQPWLQPCWYSPSLRQRTLHAPKTPKLAP